MKKTTTYEWVPWDEKRRFPECNSIWAIHKWEDGEETREEILELCYTGGDEDSMIAEICDFLNSRNHA